MLYHFHRLIHKHWPTEPKHWSIDRLGYEGGSSCVREFHSLNDCDSAFEHQIIMPLETEDSGAFRSIRQVSMATITDCTWWMTADDLVRILRLSVEPHRTALDDWDSPPIIDGNEWSRCRSRRSFDWLVCCRRRHLCLKYFWRLFEPDQPSLNERRHWEHTREWSRWCIAMASDERDRELQCPYHSVHMHRLNEDVEMTTNRAVSKGTYSWHRTKQHRVDQSVEILLLPTRSIQLYPIKRKNRTQ